MKIQTISRRRPRSVDEAEVGHLALLLCRGGQRNVQRFIPIISRASAPHSGDIVLSTRTENLYLFATV